MTNDRSPSRIPVRGSLALAITVGGLALLMGFRSPEGPTADVALAIEPGQEDSSSSVAHSSAASVPASPAAAPSPSVTAAPSLDPTTSPSASVAQSLDPTANPTSAAAATRTATGSAFQFRFGVVQVAVTVASDDIVAVEAIQLPDGDRRSAMISQKVEPMLRESALAADSADIDAVSGATYTSLAYAYSLQSALDQLAG